MKFFMFSLFLLGMIACIHGTEMFFEQKTWFDRFCVVCMLLCCALATGYGGGYLAAH